VGGEDSGGEGGGGAGGGRGEGRGAGVRRSGEEGWGKGS